MFPLVYFQHHAPASVLKHWNVLVGRQNCDGFSLRSGETEIRSEDVQVWLEKNEDRVSLFLYSEKLLPLMQDDLEKAWWLTYTLTDQVLGEISSIALIDNLQLMEQPREGTSTVLSDLRKTLLDAGCRLWDDVQDYLDNSYIGYERKSVEDPDADWRLDVFSGSTRLPVLINEYINAESGVMDDYHKDGIAAGFLCYPLSGLESKNRGELILQFRNTLQEAIQKHAGRDAVTFLGAQPDYTMGIWT